jgi:hypothetical protein
VVALDAFVLALDHGGHVVGQRFLDRVAVTREGGVLAALALVERAWSLSPVSMPLRLTQPRCIVR